jgi:branched-chain amino acid transport system ATP-binding protein
MAGLNSGEKGLVIERIRDLEKQIPVVLVEHDMDVVFSISRRIIVMNRGEVIASGAPDEIVDNRLVREIYLCE